MHSGAVTCWLIVGCWGCGFTTPSGISIDGMPDGDDSGSCTTSFASKLDTCMLAFGDDLVLQGATTYNTDSFLLVVDSVPRTAPHKRFVTSSDNGMDHTDIDVLFARNVRLADGTHFTATGLAGLAIVASGNITLGNGAQIDVSDGGAGAIAGCSNPPNPGATDALGGAGGGGGGYRTSGGDGGIGDKNAASPAMGGLRGMSISMPTLPLGGCPGAFGGAGAVPGGAPGAGGGVIYLVAGNTISLDMGAQLLAGGGGGKGGAIGNAGGGGGGTGGMIIVEARHITGHSSSVIAANGGGGGEGASATQAGQDGRRGSPGTSRADGGTNGAQDGADGGRGGAQAGMVGEGVTEQPVAGGGGGGGGVGWIRVLSSDAHTGTLSPQP